MAQRASGEKKHDRGQSATTPFSADPSDELPVGVQLSWRLRALIASGRLGPGDSLPSVRRLAEWAGVNVNTVRAVYRQLEEEGLVASQHGLGTFVIDGTPAVPELEGIAAAAIDEAVAAGATPRDFAIMAMVCATVPDALEDGVPAGSDAELPPAPPELPDLDAESDERSVRRELRRQIARLEGELAAYVREMRAPDADTPVRAPEAHVAGVEELERTRDMLLDRLSEAQDASERQARREERARGHREEMLREPEAHKWEVVTAEDAGEEGCVEYRAVPRYGPLGVLMRWWQVKVSGGCPLAGPLEAAPADSHGQNRSR